MYSFSTTFRLLTGILFGFLLTTILCTASQAQITRYVSTTGITPAASATSWAASTTSLQGAIDYVAANGGGQVWVAAGVYKPTSITNNQGASFALKNGVTIYGGFLGNETLLSQRPEVDPVAAGGRPGNPSGSTLSGDIDNDGTLANNAYHVINNPQGLTNSAVLDGFVITGGNANGGDVYSGLGGGVYNNGFNTGCSPSFRNCVLAGNSAGLGGAISNYTVGGQASPVLTNCVLQSNSATSNAGGGGAIFNYAFGGQASPVLTNCTLQRNIATYGGAICNNVGNSGPSGQASPVLTNCLLQGNSATYGGAMAMLLGNGQSRPVFTNCVLQDNSAAFGGVIYSHDSGQIVPVLTNCVLEGNSATQRGGVMYNNAGTGGSVSSPALTNCVLQRNSAPEGGVMYNRGGNGGQSNPVLTNCTLQSNSATQGGVMYNFGANGGQSGPVLTSCVLWNNGGSNGFVNDNVAGASATYSLFDNAASVIITGPGNLTTATSPFVSETSVTLLSCAPAINAGNPASQTAASGPYSATALPATDLAGNPRIFGARVDMGALEYQAAPGSPARLYVAASQTATAGDGLSWATAFPDLQSALAYPCSQSLTEIWVAQGTYRPASGSSFSMLPGVAIYGGFRGTETSLSERPSVNPVLGHPSNTTLAGNGSRVITNPGGLTRSAVLDGFVITGGGSVDQGGGMYNNGSSPTLTNCSFQGNQVMGGSTIFSTFGGAMYNGNSSNPMLTNCSFQDNQATGGLSNLGGAMYNENSSPLLTNCSFRGNQVSGSGNNGGAMYNLGSSPTLTNCSFQDNQAKGGLSNNGGAMSNINSSNPVLTNCSFQSNQVEGGSGNDGGAMYNISSFPVLTNCVVWNNGGANTFFNNSSTLTARYSLFDNTSGVDVSGPGNLTTATSPFVSATSSALNSCAFAIGSADPTTTTLTVGTTDLAGNARFTNGRLDMGAYQYQGIVSGQVRTITMQPVAGSVVCAGTPVSVPVSATGTGTSFSYQWYKGTTALTSQTTATLTLPTASMADAGTYKVVVSTGCNSLTSNSFTLSFYALPSVTVTAAPSTTLSCTNPSLTLTAQTSATAFAWSSGGSTGQTLPVSQTGVYSVTVTDGNGCTAVSNSPTISRDNTSPTVSVSALSSTLTCTQPQLTLTATASTTALLWSTGQTTTTISVSTAGTYSVTATGANGCSAVSNNLPVTENFSLPPFTIASATVCPGQTINLTASGCGGQILWSTGATTAMITLTAGSSTSLLTATCTTGVCSTTAGGQVVVGGIQPPPAQILSFTADESACPVKLMGKGIATSFTMTGPNGYVFSTVFREGGTREAIGLNVKQAGTYTLTATYSNTCGISTPVTRSVAVSRSCP